MKKSVYIIAFSLLIPCLASGQEALTGTSDTTCVQKELGDIIRAARNKPAKASAENAGSLLLLPIIGSNPATGFMIGVGGQYAFKRPGDETLFSLLSGSAQLTTKGQSLLLLKNNIYTKKTGYFLVATGGT